MQKFTDLLFHPSHIVFYYKDKIVKVLLWVLAFFSVVVGLFSLYTYTSKGYDYNYVTSIATSLQTKDNTISTEFKDKKLSGEAIKIIGSNLRIYILKYDFANNDFGLVMNFKEEEVDVYYQTAFKKTIKYSSLDIDNFTFENVRNNNRTDVLEFESLIIVALDSIDNVVKTFSLLNDVLDLLIMFAAIVVFSIILSLFINPPIDFKSRFKICIYDSLIYFVLMAFTLMIGITWIQYIAMGMPLIFTMISFRSIVRIK